TTHTRAMAKRRGSRSMRCDVGGVARPRLRAHRPLVTVDHHSEDHLSQIGPMILAVAVATQRLAAGHPAPSPAAPRRATPQPVDAGNPVVLTPAIRCAIGAADEEPVQHGEEYRSFQGKAVLARTRDLFHHRPAAGLRPTAARTPAPADASTGDLCCTVVG